ncbi:MAG: hypothetical protein M1820_006452 [Bogoriella megaspora]|nr:MAG: hypothetical protein M1820_006452 [Bogoriella megaspora]
MPLRSSFVVNQQTELPATATRDQILAMLHDHSLMITLNPLVLNHELASFTPVPKFRDDTDATNPRTATHKYSITDKISYLPHGLWDSNMTYTGWFANTADGLRTWVQAAAGVEVQGLWFVREAMGGRGLVLEEEATVNCSSLLKPFVEGELRKSHEVLHKRFLERLGQGQASNAR